MVTLLFRIELQSNELLKNKMGSSKSPELARRMLEELCFLYRRYKANDLTAKLILSGYVENLQRSKELEENSPLKFSDLWTEDMNFTDYIKKENQAFIKFISLQYLKAIRR